MKVAGFEAADAADRLLLRGHGGRDFGPAR
jgi:hypothetical protein